MQNDPRTTLKHVGLKATRARVAILQAFQTSLHPMSAQEAAKELGSGVADQATVYRIIQSFLTAGIVREVNLRHGHIDYELANVEDHHHLVCLECGLIEDFTGCGADRMAKAVLSRSSLFASVRDHAIELFGLCRACSKSLA